MTTHAKIALPDGVDCDVNTFYVSFITIPYSYFDKGRGKSAVSYTHLTLPTNREV